MVGIPEHPYRWQVLSLSKASTYKEALQGRGRCLNWTCSPSKGFSDRYLPSEKGCSEVPLLHFPCCSLPPFSLELPSGAEWIVILLCLCSYVSKMCHLFLAGTWVTFGGQITDEVRITRFFCSLPHSLKSPLGSGHNCIANQFQKMLIYFLLLLSLFLF